MNITKVWIVITVDVPMEGYTVEGVFSSKEKAEEFVGKNNAKGGLEIVDWDVD